MADLIELSDVSWVRLSFLDVFGSSHSMQIPVARFAAALEHGEPFDGSSLEGRARLVETDMRLKPDPDTVVDLGDGVARAVCTVLSADGTPWPGDPRTALAMIVEDTGGLGEELTIAAELEFYLLDEDRTPIDRGGYFGEAEGLGMAVAREAADRLVLLGVPIDSLHHEAGPSQYELDIAALSSMAAADALVLAKHVLRETAAESGLRATFMARPLSGEAGSGLHLHLRANDRLVGDDGTLTGDGRRFLAGLLEHARGLSALASPTVNSYKRLHAGPEAPSAVMWAHVNRGALLRVSPATTVGPTIEYRAADPSANPYLLFAGMLAAGAHGMIEDLEAPPSVEEETSGGFDPAASDSVRYDPLPRDLEEALGALLIDDVLADAFDRQLLTRLVDGRRAEAAAYREQVTPWELERYFDEA
jgi:glutamine synthetase